MPASHVLLIAAVSSIVGSAPAGAQMTPPTAERAQTAQDRTDAARLHGQAARAALAAQDYAGARAKAAEAIELCLSSEGDAPTENELRVLAELASIAYEAGEPRAAERARRRVLEVRSRALANDDPELQSARMDLAVTIRQLGDLPGARALFEQVLEVRSRTLAADHADVLAARHALAQTLRPLGDLQGARALFEQVLEVRSRTLGDDHRDLQATREGLGVTLFALGDLQRARPLLEKVLEVRSRTLPATRSELQVARLNLAGVLHMLGDFAGARALVERAVEVYSRTLPDDHRHLQLARMNLAVLTKELGDLNGARLLEEKVLEVLSELLPDDHPDLQAARQNLANTLRQLGDTAGARDLHERVLDVLSSALPADHPDLQKARLNLAATLDRCGELEAARELYAGVVEVFARTLPDWHPYVQEARVALAATMKSLGDFAGARALEEAVLAVRSLRLPEDHADVQGARFALAVTIAWQLVQGEAAPDEQGDWRRCIELALAIARARSKEARDAVLESSVRQAQDRCQAMAGDLSLLFSLAAGNETLVAPPELIRAGFVLAEATRGAALGTAALIRKAAGAPRYDELRKALSRSRDELAALAQRGATSAQFHQAIADREAAERELVDLARELTSGSAPWLALDPDALAAKLADRQALVGFRRYTRWKLVPPTRVAASTAVTWNPLPSLCALVLRSGPDEVSAADGQRRAVLARVDLGPVRPIEDAVKSWRESILAPAERGRAADGRGLARSVERGRELRRLVLDPLVAALGGADHVVVALDDVLHMVPLDALPLEEDESGEPLAPRLVGERWRIETRSTLVEIASREPRPEGGGVLVALGGAAFNSEPLPPSAEEVAVAETAAGAGRGATLLRGGAWERGFLPLTHAALEVRGVAELHDEVFAERGTSIVLEKRKASRESLEALARSARWLHVATHGWFAPESVRSWSDDRALDAHNGLGRRPSTEEQVKGLSPMLLCGLALAGANLPENELGRVPGLVTAEELAALDLSNCELAVLSACDTNVGERRAGQGVASLQMALHMAGARSAITSLWKVPDEATRELMVDFYRRLWVEGKPKHQALWEAKMRLRGARDEAGNLRFSTREWAAWVLTGDPE
jgi:CHAT domain-containing protein